ncbi:hypothetical protein J2X31_003649 [Flavobacterium arsenatis]|uniref:Lipoprotein n=1 Tax=Flavobacterium arsenatis TaxID=1484332 RepID=A0ABU1TUR5_9FLAO|nr:hypothetical protein [Flavobacterium arsenatis]MDR6969616.1 hypothetical protein [Flavobacterium arsenatis]
MNKKTTPFLILLLFVLTSCGSDIKTEEDKFPNIPEFPKFENDVFRTKNIATIELQPLQKFSRTFHNPFNLVYAVKDSSLYFLTFYNDDEFPEEAYLNYKYYLTLMKISDGKIKIERKWVDSDFEFNFWIKSNNDIVVGKQILTFNDDYKSSIKNDSVVINSIKGIKFERWTKDFIDNEEKTIANNKENGLVEFDNVVVDSESKLGGGWNNGFEVRDYPVYLSYYKLNWNNKTAKTKIDFSIHKNAPILLKTSNNLYYIQYNEKPQTSIDPEKNRQAKSFVINQIE